MTAPKSFATLAKPSATSFPNMSKSQIRTPCQNRHNSAPIVFDGSRVSEDVPNRRTNVWRAESDYAASPAMHRAHDADCRLALLGVVIAAWNMTPPSKKHLNHSRPTR